MTDAKIRGETIALDAFPLWDFVVEDNIVPFVEGAEGDSQAAGILAFLNKNSIPQLPGIGVPWTDFLTTPDASFAEVDTTIRYNLNAAGLLYKPVYDIVNEKLTCTVVRQ